MGGGGEEGGWEKEKVRIIPKFWLKLMGRYRNHVGNL